MSTKTCGQVYQAHCQAHLTMSLYQNIGAIFGTTLALDIQSQCGRLSLVPCG